MAELNSLNMLQPVVREGGVRLKCVEVARVRGGKGCQA